MVEYLPLKGEPVPGFNISNQKFHQKFNLIFKNFMLLPVQEYIYTIIKLYNPI